MAATLVTARAWPAAGLVASHPNAVLDVDDAVLLGGSTAVASSNLIPALKPGPACTPTVA